MCRKLVLLATYFIIASAKKTKFSIGPIPQDCLECMCQVESNCSKNLCENEKQCGYFQLSFEEWLECGQLLGDWQTCANDMECSSSCVQLYVTLYHYRCGSHTCQHFARGFHGGPENCKDPSTLPYWNNVSMCLNGIVGSYDIVSLDSL